MRFPAGYGLVTSLLLTGILSFTSIRAATNAASSTASAPAITASTPDAATVEKLVIQLGDDDYKLRQGAQSKLIKIGGPLVRAALEKASASNDSEVRQRAAEIISQLIDTELESRSAAIRKSVLWTFEVPGGAAGPPAVAADKVVFLGGDRLLYAVDTATGKEAWKLGTFTIKVGECDLPQINENFVFITDRVDSLYAIDLANGKLLWRPSNRLSWSPPCAAGGVVFIADGKQSLVALDAQTGQEKWNIGSKDYSCRPAAADGKLFVAEGLDKGAPAEDAPHVFAPGITAMDARTGERLWQFDPEARCSHLVPLAGTLYFKAGAIVGALEAKSGKKLWTFSLPGLIREDGLFAVSGEAIYATCYEKLFAIDAKSGEKKWSVDFASDTEPKSDDITLPKMIGLAVDGEGVYVGRPDGVHALDLKTGKEIWTLRTVNRMHAGPAVSEGILYFGTSQQANDAADPKKDFKAPPGLHAVKLR